MEGGTSKIRFLHNMVNDGISVNVYLDGERILTGVQRLNISEYLTVPSGDHEMALEPIASSISPEQTQWSIALSPDRAYTVMAYGIPFREMKYGPVREMQLLILEDTQARLENGKVQLRFLHGATGVPEVDLYVGGGLSLTGLRSASFASLELLPGPVELVVTRSCSKDVLGSFPVNLVDGTYTITTSGINSLTGILLP